MTGFLRAQLLRRAAAQYRILAGALALLLVLNGLAYALMVYPLSKRVNNIASLTGEAELELSAARLQHTQASNLVNGRKRSAEKLESFYRDVLPGDAAAARHIVSPRLYQLAMQAGVHPQSSNTEAVIERDRVLTRLDIRLDLTGTYDGIRRFIHLLERAPEFVSVVNIRVVKKADEDGELGAQLDLATYYKGAP